MKTSKKVTETTKDNNDLLSLAINQTKNNISKGRSSRKSISDSLLELLYGPDAKPMTKVDVVGRVSLERLNNETETEITPTNFIDDDIQKEFKRITKTVSNGFDTAVCDGKTNASFSFNPRYEAYELVKNPDSTFIIIDKK